jgi:hypothetical protein
MREVGAYASLKKLASDLLLVGHADEALHQDRAFAASRGEPRESGREDEAGTGLGRLVTISTELINFKRFFKDGKYF